MKLKKVIKENADLKSKLKEYFDIDGNVSETANGISVDGDVHLKDKLQIKPDELPFAFDKISGTLDLSNGNLTNLNNFPREVGDVFLDSNPKLTSLATQYPITSLTGEFYAKKTGITDLAGFRVNNIRKLDLSTNEKLKSLDGTSVNIGIVILKKCNAFLQTDLTKYTNIKQIQIEVGSGTTFPLTRILAFGSVKPIITLLHTSGTELGLWKIIEKYKGKGPENILDIMRDLRDAGYESNARL
jgi:hypothetical protein